MPFSSDSITLAASVEHVVVRRQILQLERNKRNNDPANSQEHGLLNGCARDIRTV